MASVIFEERVEVPLGLTGLTDFRRWAVSPDFPETGRIDFLAGTIEVDMSSEDIFCHGVLKAEVAAVLQRRIKDHTLGLLLIDSTRVVCEQADLSVEPDIVFVSHASLREGRVREFWLLDARVRPASFLIQRWTPTGFVPVDSEGGRQWSEPLGCGYRLESRGNALGGQDFDLVGG